MARLVSSTLCSLDGYVVDTDGSFAWAAPDEEEHDFINGLQREMGTMLLGRKMYDVLEVWDTLDTPEQDPIVREFARAWRDCDKVVYSTTLEEPRTERTRIETTFDAEQVRRLVADADRDVSIGGPTLAAEAFRAGLVGEVQLFLHPVVVGGGVPALPAGVRLRLTLVEQRVFGSGVVFVRYRADAA